MNKPIKTIAVALAAIAAMSVQQTEACTRATYIGPDNTVITGRTMDWKEDLMSNIYVFPRGMQRAGYNKGIAVNWTSKYGSCIAAGYDIGTCDCMNEKGLVASLLFLPESVYHRPGDNRPIMGISIWTQYVLDNFATVREAVDELKKAMGGDAYKELLQNNIGKIVRDSTKGVSIDSIWGEMTSLFPEHFSTDMMNQVEQITHAFDLMKQARADMTQSFSVSDLKGADFTAMTDSIAELVLAAGTQLKDA